MTAFATRGPPIDEDILMSCPRLLGLAACFASLLPCLVLADDKPKRAPAPSRYEIRADHDPNGIGKFYMGREIALVMGHQAADWLDRPEREKEEEPSKLHQALKLQPGMVVADIGAGSGYHTFRMSKAVGAKGKVY